MTSAKNTRSYRSSSDQGFEPAGERDELGKGAATLRLRSYFSGPSFVLELDDDGGGITSH